MKRRRKNACAGGDEDQKWLMRAVQTAPRPLPPGCFPKILDRAEAEGLSRDRLLDVLDGWLNFGYCRIADPISNDIVITDEGERFFYH